MMWIACKNGDLAIFGSDPLTKGYFFRRLFFFKQPEGDTKVHLFEWTKGCVGNF